ncbi:MAG: hypothetical protein ACXWWX_05410, partial [Actinomycetota bacterium]
GALFPNGGSDCTSTSTVNPAEETDTLALADGWQSGVDAAGRTRLSVAPLGVAGSSADGDTISFPGTGVTATLSRREVSAADAAPGTGAIGSPAGSTSFSNAVRLQDCAPRPDDLTDAALPAGMDLIAGDVNLSGTVAGRATSWNAATLATAGYTSALIVFSEPVASFGAWFGDLETRPAEPGPTEGGVPARVKLFADDPTAGPGTELATFQVPTTTPTGSCGSIAAPVNDLAEDGIGCGNQSTRFIGFHDPAGPSVRAILVMVGDDDTCPPLASSAQCNGDTESLSWLAPMLAVTPADLTIDKAATTSTPVTIGDSVSWELTVTNTGETATGDAPVVTDDLPGGLRLTAAGGAGWNCSGSTDTSVACDATGTFAAAEIGKIEITAMVDDLPDGFPGNLRYVNTATVAWDASAATSGPSALRIRSADLWVAKTGPGEVRAGDAIAWRVHVGNDGPNAATGVVVVDHLPPGTTFLSADGPGWSCDAAGRSVTCRHAGPMTSPAAAERITIRARVDEDADLGPLRNRVHVRSSTADPVAGNATDTLTTTVLAAAPTSSPSASPGGGTAGTGADLRGPLWALAALLLLAGISGSLSAGARSSHPDPVGNRPPG